jgi:DNA ligase (NAD+)
MEKREKGKKGKKEEKIKIKGKTRRKRQNIEFIIEEDELPIEVPVKKTRKTKKRRKQNIEFVIVEDFDSDSKKHVLEGIGISKTIEKKERQKEKHNKINIKTNQQIELEQKMQNTQNNDKRLNEGFIEVLGAVSDIMLKHGEAFRAKSYQKAQQAIMSYPHDITSVKQINGLPGIGQTISGSLNEYVETGTLRLIEKEKTNPVNVLTNVYGIGPKKAEELVKAGITSIANLRERQDELLNNVQKIGLQYYEPLLERIPRAEIQEYEKMFNNVFYSDKKGEKGNKDKFEIVGSFRRGAANSGDIDVIITGETGDKYNQFVNQLSQQKIITHILSRGPSKTLVIAELPGLTPRRVDFLYAPPNEFAFAILYFTGSKIFNTVMRQKALDQGYTFNEHGIYHLTTDKKKGKQVEKMFAEEKDIFDFLGLQYRSPLDRADGRQVVASTSHAVDVGSSKNISVSSTYMSEGKEHVDVGAHNSKIKDDTYMHVGIHVGVEETKLLAEFAKNGLPVLKDLSEQKLTNMLRYASKKYYNQEPVITDNQFDIIKDYIEAKFPNNSVVLEVGAEVDRNKVKLPYLMASMDKIKPDTEALNNWKRLYKGPYVISCKLDGVSGLYTTEEGTVGLYTRGNGQIGQDISHLIPHLRLPKIKNVVIRGEFIIPKTVFASKYASKFANPRNMVAGIINHKTITNAVNDMQFVAYEVIKPVLKPSEQMAFLASIDVETVQNMKWANPELTNDSLSELLVDWRSNSKYEIDGVIVANDKLYPRQTSGNPEHAFAFKMVLSDQIAEAIVVNVIWTPSKDGYLKPRVQIEPINLGGVKIEWATGFNAAFIQDNKVGIGATIQLIRSGDVIPHIKSITVPAPEAKMPDVPYIWNDTHVDIMLEDASQDSTVIEKNITGFFKGIEVDGLGGGNVVKIIDAGYNTVPKIIKMTEADFLKVEGFKQKMANKIYTGIREKIAGASLVLIMAASNIFGRGFNNKKLELIMGEIPDILVSNKSVPSKIAAVEAIKGMAHKTAEAFVSKIDDFKQFLVECGLQQKLSAKKAVILVEVDEDHPLYNKTVVLTGTRDKQVIDILKQVGANQGASVSKNTHLVVAKEKDDNTGKADEARKLGIPIISVDEFISKYK